MTPVDESLDQAKAGVEDVVNLAAHRVVDVVEGMHHAIAKPWFSLAGSTGERLHRMHRTGTASMYRLVRSGSSAAGRAVDRRVSPDTRGVDSATAVVNALWGDDPARAARSNTTVRNAAGSVLLPTAHGLAVGFPDAKHRLTILLHGLGQTERCWEGIAASLDDASTPVRIRYNSGLPVASSGAEVASLINTVVEHWPVAVNEVSLVGYSMGGLVARAAVNQARTNDLTWVANTRHVITLATPLLGSPIEKGAEAASRGLALAPQTRPLAEFVSSRSQGIKDLRHGTAADDVLPDHIEHHCVAAVVTDDPNHPVGRLVGDLVVRAKSATGRGRHRSIEHSGLHVFGGRHHGSVLKVPELAALLALLISAAPRHS